MQLPLKQKPSDDGLDSMRSARRLAKITRDAPETLIQAFRGADELERAAIWGPGGLGKLIRDANGIPGWERMVRAEALAEGLGARVTASNSIAALTGNLISQRVLELMKIKFPVLTRVVSDFSADECLMGQTLYTRYLAAPTSGDYSPTVSGYSGTTVPPTSLTSTDATIAMNAHKFATAQFTANDLSGTARRLFDEFSPALAYTLAKAMVDALYGLIVQGTFTNSTVVQGLTDFGRDALIDIGTTMDLRTVPMGAEDRTALLYPTFWAACRKDPSVVDVANQQPFTPVRGGVIPDCGGFYTVDAPNLPTTANQVGFCFSKSALILATRLPADYTSLLPEFAWGAVNKVVDPDTGLAVLSTGYVDHNLGTCNLRLTLIYGVGSGQVACGQILKTA